MRSSTSFLLLAAVVLACSASVALARPTGSASSCGYGGLDFSSLVGLDIVGSDGSSTYSYLLSICGALSSASTQGQRCLQLSPQASACQTQTQQGQAYDIGNWVGAPVWSYIDPAKPASGVQYTMTGAQSCWAKGQPQAYTATVQFVCAAKQMPLTVTVPQGSCAQTYELQTPLACSGPAPPPAPKCGATLGGTTYDFSSLMGTDLTGSDGTQTYKYFTSVCGDLSSAATASCRQMMPSASACQMQVQGGTGTYVTGTWPGSTEQVQWAFIDATNPKRGVQYTLQGAQSCWATGSDQAYTVTLQFECASTQSADFTVVIPQGSCAQTYTLQTPLACSGPAPPPAPKCGTTLNGHTFDFSSLTGTDLSGSDGTDTYAYDLSVCGVLTSTAAAPCKQISNDASACQRQLQGGTGSFDLGNWNTANQPQWEWIDESAMKDGVQYTLTGAQSCWASGRAENYITNVQLVCGTDPSPQSFKVSTAPGSCVSNFTITSSHACCDGCDGNDEDGRIALF